MLQPAKIGEQRIESGQREGSHGLKGAVGAAVRPVRTLLAGGEVANPSALTSQLVTAGLCLVFVGLCVNSFIQARRRRAAGESATM